MGKFLRKFFWSHGTLLGYLGSLSQKGRPEIFSKWILSNLSNPLRHPEPLVDPLLTKNLDTAGPQCELPIKKTNSNTYTFSSISIENSIETIGLIWASSLVLYGSSQVLTNKNIRLRVRFRLGTRTAHLSKSSGTITRRRRR